MNFNFLKFLEKKSDRPESLVVNNPMNRGYDQDAFHKRVAEKVSKDRQKYREKALCFACKNDYGHTDDINKITLNTQFYEVNTNNGYVSRPKQKTAEDTELTESTAPYFIITDKDIDPYALQSEDQEHLKTDSIDHNKVKIDLMEDESDRGGKRRRIRKSIQKRTRIRKSRQKRRTTKRRRR